MDRTKRDVLVELLVVRAQSGDARAIGELASIWNPSLVAFANKLLGDQDAAQDVVQESWIAVMRGVHRLRDPALFRAWVFRVVNHKSTDYIRERIRSRQELEQFSHTRGRITEDEPHATEDLVSSILKTIQEFDSADQALLRLFYQDELSIREIAFVNDCTPSAVKSKLFHLRKRIKQALERKNDESKS